MRTKPARGRRRAVMPAALLLLLAPAVAHADVSSFPVPSGGQPQQVVLGPDGNVWLTEQGSPRIGRVTPAGVVTEVDVPGVSYLEDVAAGPDGRIWFTARDGDFPYETVGRVATDGTGLQRFETGNVQPYRMVALGGALWASLPDQRQLLRVATDGTATRVDVGPAGSRPEPFDLAVGPGPDGVANRLWFTDQEDDANGHGQVGRVDVAAPATVDRVTLPARTGENGGSIERRPQALALGRDGRMWVAASDLGFGGGSLRGATVLAVSANGTVGTAIQQPPSPATPSLTALAAAGDGRLVGSDFVNGLLYATPTDGTGATAVALPAGAKPSGLVTGADGNLWVADGGAKAILRVPVAGGTAVPPGDGGGGGTGGGSGTGASGSGGGSGSGSGGGGGTGAGAASGSGASGGVAGDSASGGGATLRPPKLVAGVGPGGQVGTWLVTCDATSGCTAGFEATAVVGGGVTAARRKRTVRVLRTTVKVAAGGQRRVALKLSKRGRALLKRQGRLKLTLRATVRAGGRTVTRGTRRATVRVKRR